ncbi:MAG TPA: hypothetical protein VK530_06820, partial [Candidatus Acidoferrum sp.]|nr:hypothetical protein [Candidatus Acidoferrum sp.]
CVYCDLWKNALDTTVPIGAIPAQIDFALDELRRGNTRAASLKQLKLYNAGSFFDRAAIPPQDFPAVAERGRGFERVIVECHPALVGDSAVRFRDLLQAAEGGSTLEVAMGLEIADDEILSRMNKRMTLAMFARSARFLQTHDIAVRAFVMIKPPFVRDEDEAIEFATRSARFAFDCGATAVSLIPARFGTEELSALAARGEFSPPTLATIEAALAASMSLKEGRVFVDLWNLELFSTCNCCFEARRERLIAINQGQALVPPVHCHCG